MKAMNDSQDKNTQQSQSAAHSSAESLSALVDGQATELELRRLLKQDADTVNQRWARYQMMGAVMRGEPVGKDSDLLAGVQLALADEPAHSQRKGGLWAGLGRMAIAASVAGGIIFGAQQNWQQLGFGGQAPELAKQAPVVSQPSIVQQPLMAVGVSANRGAAPAQVKRSPRLLFVPRQQAQAGGERALDEQQLQRHLNALILEHANNAATNSGRGVLPYARIPKLEKPNDQVPSEHAQ